MIYTEIRTKYVIKNEIVEPNDSSWRDRIIGW